MELRYKDKVLGGSSGSGGQGGSGVPTGSITSFLGTTAPDGWVLMNGTLYQIADYPNLANFIEQQFGTKNHFGGDGETTFAVPDLSGRFVLGVSETHVFGETGGSEKVALTVEQMPAHNHAYDKATTNDSLTPSASSGGPNSGYPYLRTNATAYTSASGYGASHNNMPPYLALSYIIKT